MASYLSTENIAAAVEGLKSSSARSRMCEVLIGMRALALNGTGQVAIAESVPEYAQAVIEFTRWSDAPAEKSPYFNPFGSQAAFKSRKFPSNGPSNTIHGWATVEDSPFEIINERPKQIRRSGVSRAQLRAFTLLKNGTADRPRLIDAAIWFFRFHEIPTFGKSGTRVELEDMFVSSLALSDAEVTALFRRSDEDKDEEIDRDLGLSAAANDGETSAR